MNERTSFLSLATHHIALFLLALWLLACGGPQERKAQYRAKAKEFIQTGNLAKARVTLRNVLKIDPKDAEAYFLIAQIDEREKNWRNAVATYKHVVELAPNHNAAWINLAKYYLESRLSDQVRQAADKVLAGNPQDPQAQALKIAVLAQEDKVSQAIVLAEALFRSYPTEPDVAILLATLYGQQQRVREAESVLRQAIRSYPHHLDLLNSLKAILIAGHDARGAEQVLRQVIGEEPTVFDHRLQLARFYDQQKRFEEAQRILNEATSDFADREEPWLALAEFLDLRRSRQEAEQTFHAAIHRLPKSTKLRLGLASCYERHRDETSARTIYESLVNEYGRKPAGLEAQVKIAMLDFSTGRYDEADGRLADVLRAHSRSVEGLILQGKIALARRKGKEAVQAFRSALRDQPEQPQVQLLLGQAHIMNGEEELARESLERAIALNPALGDSVVALAMLDSQTGNVPRARSRLRTLLNHQPTHVPALDLSFTLDLETGDWIQAKATLARLRAASGEGVVTSMAEGRLFAAQGDILKASKAFERATTFDLHALEPLIALIRLELDRGQIDRVRRRLETLVNAHPNHPYGHGLLGEVLALSGHREEAATQFREATRVNPTWIMGWLNWANLALSQLQPEAAVRILKDGIAGSSDNEDLHMLLASVLARQGSLDAAIEAYETVLRLNPHNILSANNLAALLVDSKGDTRSIERAFALSRDFERNASHPLFLDTLGWVRLKMGHHEDAMRLIKQAIAKAPDLPALNYHLGAALYQAGQKVEAKVYLTKALNSIVTFQGRQEAELLLAKTSG